MIGGVRGIDAGWFMMAAMTPPPTTWVKRMVLSVLADRTARNINQLFDAVVDADPPGALERTDIETAVDALLAERRIETVEVGAGFQESGVGIEIPVRYIITPK
jgi:hypothetical protein